MADKTDIPPKTYRSKSSRVAVASASGECMLGRQWLVDATETCDRNPCGARIWLEHLRSLLREGPFCAYGDAIALNTEEIEIAGKQKSILFAQVASTAGRVAVTQAHQMIHTRMAISSGARDVLGSRRTTVELL